jgi:hypothetical protein
MTASVYTSGYTYTVNSGTASGPTRASLASYSFAAAGFYGSTKGLCVFDLHSPYATADKAWTGVFGGNPYVGNSGGYINAPYQYDGFTLYTTSGTFAGTIRIYGYRNS